MAGPSAAIPNPVPLIDILPKPLSLPPPVTLPPALDNEVPKPLPPERFFLKIPLDLVPTPAFFGPPPPIPMNIGAANNKEVPILIRAEVIA